jgi:hypothetical protein
VVAPLTPIAPPPVCAHSLPACIEHFSTDDAANAHIMPRVICDQWHRLVVDLEGKSDNKK